LISSANTVSFPLKFEIVGKLDCRFTTTGYWEDSFGPFYSCGISGAFLKDLNDLVAILGFFFRTAIFGIELESSSAAILAYCKAKKSSTGLV
jgi:hypothetical protein